MNRKKEGLPAALILAGGCHGNVRQVITATPKTVREPPRIEPISGGWWRVIGGEFGPSEVFGKQNAERALKELLERNS